VGISSARGVVPLDRQNFPAEAYLQYSHNFYHEPWYCGVVLFMLIIMVQTAVIFFIYATLGLDLLSFLSSEFLTSGHMWIVFAILKLYSAAWISVRFSAGIIFERFSKICCAHVREYSKIVVLLATWAPLCALLAYAIYSSIGGYGTLQFASLSAGIPY
jgi:hypothetical protein